MSNLKQELQRLLRSRDARQPAHDVDLSGEKLEGADLVEVQAEELDASDANLRGANLSNAWLYSPRFTRAASAW